jgi:hypothetical protein
MRVHGCLYLPDVRVLTSLLSGPRPPKRIELRSGVYALTAVGYEPVPRAAGRIRPAVPPQSVGPPALRVTP